MPVSVRRNGFAALALSASVLAGCAQSPAPEPESTRAGSPSSPAGPPVQNTVDTEAVTVDVPADLAAAPFDEPRQAVVPRGWSMSVWARTPRPRLAAWAPDGTLLVSAPSAGTVARFTADGAAAGDGVLLEDLDQPHGLAFDGPTLYVAESDEIVAYDYADGPRPGAGSSPAASPTPRVPSCAARMPTR
ncbi:hypothetical protein MDUV_41370 [Mycolicibacterium duvalii]|uniref:Gluconolaconase n=1 Tax=Mycolicibacterium duvalii TaxID=39688 RepID=A0A7I7K5D9_9MYCO|nr:hypothetical protein MDUV_41370 [Mycolicibacterium duvalii]